MAHSLRKYLSNRGSALFMVLSTMTALMIACMAMYFSVVSSRTTQFATFFREQSYQSALSLNDMVLAGLMDGTLASGDTDLLSELSDLKEGQTITTGANGFKSFDSTLSGSDIEQMGAYTMDITRLPNEMVNGRDNMTFDVATTTLNNGVADTVHTYIHVELANEEIPNGDNIFAATGYVPNDTYLDAGYYMTDVFFDTEFTYLSLFSSNCRFAGDLRTGGSMQIKGAFMQLTDGTNIGATDAIYGRYNPVTWAIRGDLDIDWTGCMPFKSGSKVYIGGNVDLNGGGFEVDGSGTIDVYILGDLKVPDSGIKTDKVNLYVQGNIIGNQIGTPASLKTCKDTTFTHTTWDLSDVMAIKRELNRETYSKTYRKWIINDGDPAKGLSDKSNDYVEDLDVSRGKAKEITIELNDSNSPCDGVPALTSVYTIAYPGSNSDDGTANFVGKGGIIKGVKGTSTGNLVPLTVVIDTGNDEKNVMTLRVSGYLADDGKTPDPSGRVFKWFTTCSTTCQVIVKGKGILVIDIPEGVIYQDCDRQKFMHYSWFKLLGGIEGKKTVHVNTAAEGSTATWEDKEVDYYDGTAISTNSSPTAVSFIHTNCGSGNPHCHCSYSAVDAKDKDGHDIKCSKHADQCKQRVICSVHGNTSVADYCPKCDDFTKKKVEKLTAGSFAEGVCDNRLDEEVVDAYCASHGISLPDGIYPKCDIFLVSSDESSEIRLSNDLAGGAIMHNGFYGFIYAPYMSFKAEGSSGSGGLRLCGGLVVSDYAINDHLSMANLYPTKMPNDLMGESSDVMTGLTEKSWKISLGSY